MTHLERLGNAVEISLNPDEQGYLGRECPNPECEGYFKIVLGTGIQEGTDCYCPYCGYHGIHNEFFTTDQIEYAKSMVLRKVEDALVKDWKELEFESKSRGSFGIGVSFKVNSGRPHPIHYYREKDLETHIECPQCTLKYAVYGLFAFCPDCGQHNSLQILKKNLEIATKMAGMADTAEKDVAEKLVENALEDCVSAFDGFGREVCRINAAKSSFPEKVHKISFQSLDSAKDNMHTYFGFDIAQGVTPEEWICANISFQKRHLIAHKMGIIDDDYVRRSGDSAATVGHKVIVTPNDVVALIPVIEKFAEYIVESMKTVALN
jgi:hypothetical protein